MVSRCYNPACGSEFKLLNTGALYALESKSADTEFFWTRSITRSIPPLSQRASSNG